MTARGVTLSFLILAVAAVPMAAVDPALMKLVPPDATVVAGVNVEQARITPFGQFVLKQMPLDDEGFRKMMEATGFDPRRDLREILVASKGGQPSRHIQGIVMATGSFDPARILAAAKVAGVTATDYAGVEILSSKESPNGGFAFLDRSLAIAGETEQVKAAIDRYKKGGTGPAATCRSKIESSGCSKVESSGCARVPEQIPPFPLVRRASHRIAAGSCQGRTGFVRRRGAFTGGRDAT